MSQFELIGLPCAHRGPYTFYKAFKYTKNNVTNIITINEFFFVKLWSDSDLICIGELRLLWQDKNCDTTLASLRLYILPENTLEGRNNDLHGEDEVLAITERVVIKLEDLLSWITEASDWNWGLSSVWNEQRILDDEENAIKTESNNDFSSSSSAQSKNDGGLYDHLNCLADCSAIDYTDLRKEKKQLDMKNWETRTGVIVLSYARYCRYRGLVKRLEGVHDEWLRNRLISALGGFTTSCRVTKILFCKDTFDYPDLEGHELLCNHLAPKLKGEIMKKKKLYLPTASEESDSSEYESSSSGSSAQRLGGNATASSAYIERKDERIPSMSITAYEEEQRKQRAFVQNLYSFMKARLTPIGRLPLLGSKEINLCDLYEKVIILGGYASVTEKKLWQPVYEAIGGEKGNPVGDTIVRKHYEKFLLPYELHVAQQFKHSSSPSAVKQQPIVKNSHSANSRFDARLPQPNAKPGDKENIPFAHKHTSMLRPEETRTTVINLCDGQIEHRRPMSTTAAEVIDLCEDLPIKRSIPSIAATLQPKKRKLDALREGGLEVTPVAFDASSFRGEVTITKKTVSNPVAARYETQPMMEPWRYIARHEAPDMTIRPWPLTTTTAAAVTTTATTTARSQKSEVLDLRTSKNNDNNIIKKLGPSLGPSIEISLIPTGSKQDERKRRPPPALLQPPVPGLKKIWTGAPMKRESHHHSHHNQQRMARQAFEAPPMQNQYTDLSQIRSLFLAELCGTWLRNSTTGGYRDMGSDEQIARQLGLNEQQWHYLKNSFSRPKNGTDEDERNNLTLEAMAQRYANVFRNNTVSIIENYEKILPD